MSVPSKLNLSGASVIGPVQASCDFPSGQDVLQLKIERIVNGKFCTARSINSPSPAFVDLLTGTGITKATFVALKVRSGTFVIDISTSAGANQVFDLSDLYVKSNPAPGSEITGLRIQGVGDIEVQLAGDP